MTRPYYASFYQNNRLPFFTALLFYCIMSLDGPLLSWTLGGAADAAVQMSMQEMLRIQQENQEKMRQMQEQIDKRNLTAPSRA